MSDQLALGLLTSLLEKLELRVDELTARVDELEGMESEEEGGTYMDGTPVR